MEEILKKANEWVKELSIEEQDRKEVQELIESDNKEELTERFYRDLEFGTGGLRAILGNGSNRISKYTIRRATQALCNALLRAFENPKVAIGYDSRKFSDDFAKEAATVFAANGIKAYLFNHLNPVCLLSYAIRNLGCQGGIMVTASHNPPKYNGYKVYWADGAQVTPPNDQNIIDQYNSLTDWEQINFMNFDHAMSSGMVEYISKDVEDSYYEMIHRYVVNANLCQEKGSNLKIVYTPIHGTGLIPCTRILTEMGFSDVLVPTEQAKPDHTFPTVISPNPENPSALKIATDLMIQEDADIVFGTDPDTDRLGVAIRNNEEIFYPNGNQIGSLMLYYLLSNLKEQNKLPDNGYFVKTIVTTDLQRKIAESFEVEIENTLTGFKWICGKMKEIEENQPHRNFLFATEESFGYMNHDNVRDKDGVCSVALMAELTLWYKERGMTLIDGLNEIYEKYDFHQEGLLCLDYEGKQGAEKIERIMSFFRSNITSSFNNQEITQIEDYLKGTISHTSGEIKVLTLPKSNVLGYSFRNGDKMYLRPSGTEPKIKFYLMVNEKDGAMEQKKVAAEKKIRALEELIRKTAAEL